MNPYVVEAVCREQTKEAWGPLNYFWGKRDARIDFEMGATPNTSRGSSIFHQFGYDRRYRKLRDAEMMSQLQQKLKDK